MSKKKKTVLVVVGTLVLAAVIVVAVMLLGNKDKSGCPYDIKADSFHNGSITVTFSKKGNKDGEWVLASQSDDTLEKQSENGRFSTKFTFTPKAKDEIVNLEFHLVSEDQTIYTVLARLHSNYSEIAGEVYQDARFEITGFYANYGAFVYTDNQTGFGVSLTPVDGTDTMYVTYSGENSDEVKMQSDNVEMMLSVSEKDGKTIERKLIFRETRETTVYFYHYTLKKTAVVTVNTDTSGQLIPVKCKFEDNEGEPTTEERTTLSEEEAYNVYIRSHYRQFLPEGAELIDLTREGDTDTVAEVTFDYKGESYTMHILFSADETRRNDFLKGYTLEENEDGISLAQGDKFAVLAIANVAFKIDPVNTAVSEDIIAHLTAYLKIRSETTEETTEETIEETIEETTDESEETETQEESSEQ